MSIFFVPNQTYFADKYLDIFTNLIDSHLLVVGVGIGILSTVAVSLVAIHVVVVLVIIVVVIVVHDNAD